MPTYEYRKSHCEDKTSVRSFYLHNGIPDIGKMAFYIEWGVSVTDKNLMMKFMKSSKCWKAQIEYHAFKLIEAEWRIYASVN